MGWNDINDEKTGKWIVHTEHSSYVMDLDERTAKRIPHHAHAATLYGDGEKLHLDLFQVTKGEPMELFWNDELGDPHYRYTTPVTRIVKAPEE